MIRIFALSLLVARFAFAVEVVNLSLDVSALGDDVRLPLVVKIGDEFQEVTLSDDNISRKLECKVVKFDQPHYVAFRFTEEIEDNLGVFIFKSKIKKFKLDVHDDESTWMLKFMQFNKTKYSFEEYNLILKGRLTVRKN